MKLTDEKIDEMIAKTPEDTEVSEEFKERMEQLLKNLVEDPAYPRPRRKMPARAAAIALCVVLFSTVSVGAAISKLQERMEAMPDSEVEKNVSELEEADRHADNFSRELSEQEKEQLRNLAAEYERGLRFPEGELFTADYAADIQPGVIGFAAAESTFILPDAQLSEEEMLQMIDFYYKRDFSLDKINAAKDEAVQVQAGALTEEEALQIARELVENVVGLDLDGCETEIMDHEGNVRVQFLQNEKSYNVLVNKESRRVSEFDCDTDKMKEMDIPADEQMYIAKYEEIAGFLVNQIGITEPFESAFCIYGEKTENGTLFGCLGYYFEVEDSYYIIGYDANNDQIVEMDIEKVDEFEERYTINNEQAAKAGIQNKRIDFITSNTKENQEELK